MSYWDKFYKDAPMSSDHEQSHKTNQEHLSNPKVGDYWNEMFAPICVVVGRTQGEVVVCRKIKEVDDNHWTWDLRYIERMSLADFRKKLTYDNRTWCNVAPEPHKWVRKVCFKEVLGENTSMD